MDVQKGMKNINCKVPGASPPAAAAPPAAGAPAGAAPPAPTLQISVPMSMEDRA